MGLGRRSPSLNQGMRYEYTNACERQCYDVYFSEMECRGLNRIYFPQEIHKSVPKSTQTDLN